MKFACIQNTVTFVTETTDLYVENVCEACPCKEEVASCYYGTDSMPLKTRQQNSPNCHTIIFVFCKAPVIYIIVKDFDI